jgi:type IV secretion system protein VirB5
MKKLRSSILSVVCVFGASTAHAGIPVIDGAAIANIVTSYKQLMQEYELIKKQYNSTTGARGMGGLLTNPAVKSQLPPDWKNVMANIKSTSIYTVERNKLPQSTDPSINAVYDNVAVNNATMADFFKRANSRLEQVAQLQASIDSADDPAAKADLQNRMVSEQNSIASTSQLLAVLKEKQAQDLSDARAAASRSRMCSEFKTTGC